MKGMLRFVLPLVLLLSACALPPAADTSRLQYLAPPTFAAEYDLAADGGSFADDRGFRLVLQPRGSSNTVEIGGGTAAEAVFAASQPIEGDDRREAMMVRGVNAARVEAADSVTIVWREGASAYYVTVTSADPQTVQIFVNALASYSLADWRMTVGLP
jgi:hypothetical protein